MDSDDEMVGALLANLIEAEDEEARVKRLARKRKWVHEINQKRDTFGEFSHMFPDLCETDMTKDNRFFRYFRMNKANFDYLYKRVKSRIRKRDTNWRKAVHPKQRLALTLRYV